MGWRIAADCAGHAAPAKSKLRPGVLDGLWLRLFQDREDPLPVCPTCLLLMASHVADMDAEHTHSCRDQGHDVVG